MFEIGVLLTPSFKTMTPRQPKFAVLTRLSSSDRANKAAGQPSRASATSSRRRRHQRTVWGGVGGRVGNHEGREFDVGGASQRGLKARPRRAQRRRGGPQPRRPVARRSVQRLPASAAPSALTTAPCIVGPNSGPWAGIRSLTSSHHNITFQIWAHARQRQLRIGRATNE